MSKTVSKFALTAGIMLAMAFTFSCDSGGGGSDGNSSSSVVNGGGVSSSSGGGQGGGNSSSGCEQVGVIQGDPVSYAGETYPTVVIGSQTWFAKDLNYNASGSGYDWATAMALPSSCNSGSSCSSQIQSKHKGVCPSGWHIPSNAEWTTLTDCVGGSSTAGTKLKATSGWQPSSYVDDGSGTDDYGFSALPISDGASRGAIGYWWSASDYEYLDGYDYAYIRAMIYLNASVTAGGGVKSSLRSVRCVQD